MPLPELAEGEVTVCRRTDTIPFNGLTGKEGGDELIAAGSRLKAPSCIACCDLMQAMLVSPTYKKLLLDGVLLEALGRIRLQ